MKAASIWSVVCWTAIAVVVALLLAGFWFIYRGVQVPLEAEITHHAYCQVLEALDAYVRENSGQWPPSWEELSKFSLQHDPSGWDRLGGFAEVRRRVQVRFDVTADEVAALDSEDFSAAKPVRPHYGEDLGRIERLKETCRLNGVR